MWSGLAFVPSFMQWRMNYLPMQLLWLMARLIDSQITIINNENRILNSLNECKCGRNMFRLDALPWQVSDRCNDCEIAHWWLLFPFFICMLTFHYFANAAKINNSSENKWNEGQWKMWNSRQMLPAAILKSFCEPIEFYSPIQQTLQFSFESGSYLWIWSSLRLDCFV